ncbi:MAG TPA: hypothetical protein VMR34_00495 [Candidatus Saccharimonadales bacterium]|nr:hypothetical protein [Candidatus Saccharimonadales bacterium]
MSSRYRYGHRSHWRKTWHGFLVVAVLSAILFGIGLAVKNSLINNQPVEVSGAAQVVGKVLGDNTTALSETINQPTFSLSLPSGWAQTAKVDTPDQNSVTWAINSGEASISMTIYTDTIPVTQAVNLELPVQPHGSGMSWGSLSDDCTDFTSSPPGSTVPVAANWQGVPFLCNYPDRFDNKIGTGSVGSQNSVSIAGPRESTHKYFILYVDHSAEPDYSTLYDILNSFSAK